MAKVIRWLAVGVGALLALVVVAMLVLPMIVDPNDYKDEISQAVESATGRTLSIEGNLELSVFPWLGVEIGETALSNAKGFSAQPFARVDEVQVRVKLLPLLSRHLVMDTVVLKGLQVSLETDKAGRTNWQDLAGGGRAGASSGEPEQGAEGVPALAGLAVGGVRISNARIVWDDRRSDSHYLVDALNLETGAIRSGRSVPVSLSMKVSGTGLPESGLVPKLNFDLAVDPDAQTLRLSGLRFELAGLTLEGELQGAQILGDARFDGAFQVKEFAPRELIVAMGQAEPETSDPAVLGRASAALKLAATTDSVTLSNIQIWLDDSTIDGNFSVANFARPAIRFDIRLDAIDVDRYLPPQQEVAPVTPTTAAAAGAGMIPVETLRGLDVAGKLYIGELKAAQLRSRDVTVQLKAKDGVVRVHPATASMYKGHYKGDISLNVRGAKPVIALDETLSGVQVGPLLTDLIGQDRLQGTTDANAQLTAKGQTPDELMRTLNGNLAFAFSDGAVKGINLIRLIRQAQAAIKGKTLPPSDEPEQTDFSELSGTATVTNGVVRNNDLLARSPLLRVNGKGKVNLPAETIDYLLTVKLVGSLEGQGGRDLQDLRGVAIPVQVSGTFAAPEYTLKLDSAVRDVAKQKIRKEIGKKLEKQFGDKLKGLFR